MEEFPVSPTKTTKIQREFALAIRREFRKALEEANNVLEADEDRFNESLRLNEGIKADANFLNVTLERTKRNFGPIVSAFITAAWNQANKGIANDVGINWMPYDERVKKAIEQETFNWLFDITTKKQEELKKLLSTGMSQGDTVQDIAKEIKENFKLVAWKSEQVARSAIIKTHAFSTLEAIRQGGVTEEYKWLTSRRENVCRQHPGDVLKNGFPATKTGYYRCHPLHGKIFKVNDPNAPKPVHSTHPNCNCAIVPFVRG